MSAQASAFVSSSNSSASSFSSSAVPPPKPSGRSVIFQSSLYNNSATVRDENPLPDPLPILTPPPTPHPDRHQSHPLHLHLPPPSLPSSQPISLTAVISPRTGPADDEKEGVDNSHGLRRRPVTRSQDIPRSTASAISAVTSADSSSSSTSDAAPPPPPAPATAEAPETPTRVHPSQIPPSLPFHRKCQPSILSAEAAPVNIRGLYNLAGITLFTLTARLVLENISKYVRSQTPSSHSKGTHRGTLAHTDGASLFFVV